MRIIKYLTVILIVLLAVIGGVSYWIYSSLNKPHQHGKANVYIQIPKGSTPTEIISKLSGEGILAGEMPTLVYLRTMGNAN
ncbi:MAG: hypothetical protein M3T96_06675, partial [Acidobacteriota bacterium]|nr:hypothetical protein [Acidobacteriota bacterium]